MTTLGKRKLPRRELPWIGTLLDKLPYSKLPTKSRVLRRLLFEVEQNHGSCSISEAAVITKNELKLVWEYAGYGDILKQDGKIIQSIKDLHKSYHDLVKVPVDRREKDTFKKKEQKFTLMIGELLDITVKKLHTSRLITEEDRDFLLNHWDKTISSCRDIKAKVEVEKKLARAERYNKFSEAESSTAMLPRADSANSNTSQLNSTMSSTGTEEFTVPEKRSRRSTDIRLTDKTLKNFGATADRLNMSSNQLTGIIASLTNQGGGDIDQIPLSKSTANRHRAAARKSASEGIKKNFSCTHAQIGFDAKLMKDLNGYDKVNRLAVVLVQENENKLLAISKSDGSTGKVEAETVKKVLDEWGIADNIIACGFDTTSSNTGVHKGACTILQQLLAKLLLWMACRHHSMELIIAAAYITIFGPTTGPEVTLFKGLQEAWNSLDPTDIDLPTIPPSLLKQKEDLLSFINSKLSDPDSIPRDDYKEFLELAKLYLGGTVSRKKGYQYKLQRPGADHQARWMSKAIYILKMALLHKQLKDIHWTKKKKIQKMAQFVVFVYLKPWFNAPRITSAASNDLDLYSSLVKFRKLNKKVADKCCTVLKRHTWYLTEDLITFSLFDEDLPITTRTDLARRIHQKKTPAELTIRKPTLPDISEKSELIDFVGRRSVLLFNLIGVSSDFLAHEDWHLSAEYEKAKATLRNLSATNDGPERAISLMTNFNTHITRNEDSFQDMLQVIEHHRKHYSFKTKKDLKNFR